MAITATRVKLTPYEQTWLLEHDGAAGDAFVLTTALITAGMPAGPLKNLLDADVVGANQASARKTMLGEGTAGVPTDRNDPHCETLIRPRAGIITWTVDADTDAVTATRYELNIATTSLVAGSALLNIRFVHTYDR